MLIIRRRINEKIIINGNIIITITEIDGKYVVLGFDAPSNVRIMREELLDPVENNEKLENK